MVKKVETIGGGGGGAELGSGPNWVPAIELGTEAVELGTEAVEFII